MDAFTVVNYSVNNIYTLDSEIHQQHSVNTAILDGAYVNLFNEIMMLDPCSLFNQNLIVNTADCEVFADGTVEQGMSGNIEGYLRMI